MGLVLRDITAVQMIEDVDSIPAHLPSAFVTSILEFRHIEPLLHACTTVKYVPPGPRPVKRNTQTPGPQPQAGSSRAAGTSLNPSRETPATGTTGVLTRKRARSETAIANAAAEKDGIARRTRQQVAAVPSGPVPNRAQEPKPKRGRVTRNTRGGKK